MRPLEEIKYKIDVNVLINLTHAKNVDTHTFCYIKHSSLCNNVESKQKASTRFLD